ncbi:MAG: NADH-quinone oxidoreductase subunit C [Rhodocyclaceae bacterium]
MRIDALDLDLERLPAPLSMGRRRVGAAQWSSIAIAVAQTGGRLVSLWGRFGLRGDEDGCIVSAAYALPEGLVWIDLALAGGNTGYPDISGVFPCAGRMQRAVADLLGLKAEGAADPRPWFNHGAWPADHFPLRRSVGGGAQGDWPEAGDYPFVNVRGDGVHEIPVGPVHAGIIEPGHFRFSAVGEKVLRLEERLGYKHKGIDKRFQDMPAHDGYRMAGRVSGDSTVAFAWAYCMALETAAKCLVPPRAQWLRALMLERERVANHLGDLGALGNDAAFAFGLAQFMRLKEDWLRLNKALFGHRFMMDRVVPGGVSVDLDSAGVAEIVTQCGAVAEEVRALSAIYEGHSGLQDRFITTGRVTPQQAVQLGLTGLAGRASGIARDLRANYPIDPYADLDFQLAGHRNGDVAARVAVRFAELMESLRLIRLIAEHLPLGSIVQIPDPVTHASRGAGWVEGWRGEVFVAIEVADDNTVARCHCHDPSWQNWPVLEHAVIGNIVPDFPLINKSFNLSYAGHDR